MKTICVQHWQRDRLRRHPAWVVTLDGRPITPTCATIAQATHAAVAWARGCGEPAQVTGHPDRSVLAAAGIPYSDSRGNDRRGAGAQAHQRLKMQARIAAHKQAGPPTTPPASAPAHKGRSPAQLGALAAARAKRAIAQQRRAPEGYRSVEHFLDSAREFVGRRSGAVMALARYLDVGDASVRRWLRREKIPLQPTLEAINRWMLSGGN